MKTNIDIKMPIHYHNHKMNATDFAYWLREFFEIQKPTSLNEEQTNIIKEHLDKVFESYKNEDGSFKVFPLIDYHES